jgi:phospholipase/carboxylesterase
MQHERITRRRFGAAIGSAFGALAFSDACVVATREAADQARLTARPRSSVTTSLTTGPLGLGDGGRDGVVQMPSAAASGPVPLLLFLHGATQSGAGMLRRIGPAADEAGVAVLAPDSRETSWDAIRGGFGADVVFLNRALEHVFARLPVDPTRLAIGGFSDGASYALSLGLSNGDVFEAVIAFSPGFVVPLAPTGKPRLFFSHGTSDPILPIDVTSRPITKGLHDAGHDVACSPGFVLPTSPNGRPRVFVSHGLADQILPIDQCSRVIVPRLRTMGYEVTFREFEGRHEMPAAIVREGLQWMRTR